MAGPIRELERLSQCWLTNCPTLYPWDTKAAVVDLQRLLNAQGFTLKLDGDFGSVTESAVRAFQRQQHLRVNGIVNDQTWRLLKLTVKAGIRNLRQGDSGADVYELQGLLRVHGHLLNRDGLFDLKTHRAVVIFQGQHHLQNDGHVGAITWTVLYGKGPLPTPPKQIHWCIDSRYWL